jgi:hypothetical protein
VQAALLAAVLALGCAACEPLASSNTLGPGVASGSPLSCPYVYSFENGSLADWSAPTWPGGFNGMVIDTEHAYDCGDHALHLKMSLGGPSNQEVVLQTYFAQPLTLNAAPVQLWAYFGQTPPPGTEITVVLIGQNLGWAWSSSSGWTTGFSAGNWSGFDQTVSGANFAGFELQFSSTSSSVWSGDVWIDDINW